MDENSSFPAGSGIAAVDPVRQSSGSPAGELPSFSDHSFPSYSRIPFQRVREPLRSPFTPMNACSGCLWILETFGIAMVCHGPIVNHNEPMCSINGDPATGCHLEFNNWPPKSPNKGIHKIVYNMFLYFGMFQFIGVAWPEAFTICWSPKFNAPSRTVNTCWNSLQKAGPDPG